MVLGCAPSSYKPSSPRDRSNGLWPRAPIGAAIEDESEGTGATESSVVVAGGGGDGALTVLMSAVKDHVERSGGSTIIFLFQFAYFVLVLALLGLSIFCFLGEEEQQQPSFIDSAGLRRVDSLRSASKHGRKKPKHYHGHEGGSFSER